MEIVSSTTDGVVTLEFKGKLDAESSPQGERTVHEVLKSDCTKLLLDLTGLEYISSAGLRVLLLANRGMRQKSGHVAVFGARGPVKDVIDVSGLGVVLGIVDGRDEACARLRGAA